MAEARRAVGAPRENPAMRTQNFGPLFPSAPHLLHGGDYNPDQWLHRPDILAEDLRLMPLAHCNTMSVAIFSWVSLEPAPGVFDFQWLDCVLDDLHARGLKVLLATPTGGKPAWLSQRYPEVRRVDARGQREPQAGRHNHCYTSKAFRRRTTIINRELAERYKDHPAVIGWHVSNEYSGECYCSLCFKAFRRWLRTRYSSLEELNRVWWADFWSHRFTKWRQIDNIDGNVHGMVLDWKRFVTHQTVDFFLHECRPLREITKDRPVTVNMMGQYQQLDYWKFAPHVDFISWDAYPDWSKGNDIGTAIWTSFHHDLFRSMKQGQPFLLMECTPSGTNWAWVGRAKRPGLHRLSGLQALAHGSDSVMYFQWRQSRGSCEKYHGAIVSHAGHENTRIFREVSQLGQDLEKLPMLVGSSVKPQVAVLLDWENGWAIDEMKGPRTKDKNYYSRCVAHYGAFWRRGIPADVIDSEQSFDGYKLLVAPMLHLLKPGVAERIARFVEQGGTFVTTYLAGMVDQHDLCFLGGFPGPLREVLGIWVEENDAFCDGQTQTVIPAQGDPLGLSGTYAVSHYADVLHSEGAQVLATFGHDYYRGGPALTRNRVGQGAAYYIASRNDERFLRDFYRGLEAELNLERVVAADLPTGVTAQLRGDGQREYVFLMNFTDETHTFYVEGSFNMVLLGTCTLEAQRIKVQLGPFGCAVLERDSAQASS
jgi:beta-galactosidase